MNLINSYKKTFPNLSLFTLSLELENLLSGSDSVLDLGCGDNSPIGFIDRKNTLAGVDAYKKSIDRSKKAKIHDTYLCKNILTVDKDFKKGSFDSVIALDVIEHLTKKDGYKLIKIMEKIAKKRIIILTPNGFVPQTGKDNHLQEHLSGWKVSEFKKMGFKVLGRYGLKNLRKEKAELKYKPKAFWGLISEASNILYAKNKPSVAYSLLCYKDVK